MSAGKKTSLRLKLTFPQELIKEPVIFTMAKVCDIIPSIRRAKVTETAGEMVLELEGSKDNLDRCIEYLRDKGVIVELAEGDVIE